jgi:cytochrome c-type biogenesis protein CcmE
VKRARFAIAIVLAAGLGGWLAWTSLGGSLETYTSPAALIATPGGDTYRLNGVVAPGAPSDAAARAQSPSGLRFVVRDKDTPSRAVPVLYRGAVPDTFKVGREVVVTGHLEDGTFVANRNGLTTLCPSKFQAKANATQPPAPAKPVTPSDT